MVIYILGMLYQCLTFLRQAGFWEQMWETIRINLCLNLNISQESVKFQNLIDEKNISKEISFNNYSCYDLLFINIIENYILT